MRHKKRRALESSSFRRKRERRLVFRALVIFAVLGLVVSGISYLSFLEAIQVRTVSVRGATESSVSALTAMATELMAKPNLRIFSRNTIFSYPKQEIRDKAVSYSPRIKDVEIKAEGLHEIVLAVTERTPVALWCGPYSTCLYMDADGFSYEQVGDVSDDAATGTLVRFINTHVDLPVGTTTVEASELHNMLGLVDELGARGHAVQKIYITEDGDAEFALKENTRLIMTPGDDIKGIMERFVALFGDADVKARYDAGTLAYIDMRFGNKVYVKSGAKGSAAKTASSSQASTTKATSTSATSTGIR